MALGEAAAGPKDFAVYTTRLGGDAESAQPYIDKFAAYLEGKTGWTKGSAKGAFVPSRKEIMTFIEGKQPGFGVLEPELFLELRKSQQLEPIAQIVSEDLNTPRLSVVVKNPALKTLDDLAGKRVWTPLAGAPRYLGKVALDGKGEADKRFQLKQIGQAMKGARAVLRGEADATLLDDGQLAEAKKLEGGGELRSIYTSKALPPVVVVAFGKSLPAADRKVLAKTLLEMCGSDKGGEICKEMHITKFVQLDTKAFGDAQTRYEQP